MIKTIEAIGAALAAGTNPVTAIREATGYTIEQMGVTSGLTTVEIVDLEAGVDGDRSKIVRLALSLGLPEGLIRA